MKGWIKTVLILSAFQSDAQAFCGGSQQLPETLSRPKAPRSSQTAITRNTGENVDATFARSATSLQASPNGGSKEKDTKKYKHILALLTIPYSSIDRIANEAILNTAVAHTTGKLSVVLRCEGKDAPSLSSLRRYVGEVYSMLWDVAMATGNPDFLDVVVYPQNLPNAAPEQWVNHLPDLDCVCSHDSICGWVSQSATGRGLQFRDKEGDGMGGLDDHVVALNADRAQRKMRPVTALHVSPWPTGASAELQQEYNVAFLDDDVLDAVSKGKGVVVNGEERDDANGNNVNNGFDSDTCDVSYLVGGARIPTACLFEKVAVGGTFDGLHYGHRKLLTLAVSSVSPISGKLMVGITVDEMLRNKSFADHIPSFDERMEGVRDFLYRLAPGMKNRFRLRPITDAYGPPGTKEEGPEYDALVLSHETLDNGCKLNKYRQEVLGIEPLTLLCTRRTETYGMSSTALRRLRFNQQEEKQKQEGANV